MASKKIKKNVPRGIAHIQNSFNNTIITITDIHGNAIAWSSAGSLNFKGAKKSTPYASQTVAATAVESALKYGLKDVDVYVKGPGFGRESAIRAIAKAGINVLNIVDVTGIPHNGCRPRKLRRI